MSYNASFVSALKEALNGLKTIHQVGEEWVSYVGDIPTGGVPYCGQEVSRSTYAALWEYANAKGLVKTESQWQSLYKSQGGNVAYYSSGNGSSTFRMPRLVGYVRGASSQSESGSYVAEGLPNIEGGLDYWGHTSAPNDGAFVNATMASYVAPGGGSTIYRWQQDFDASASNAIYGNSSHVTPETSVVLYGVYAFGEIGNTSALDASTLASSVARVESNLNEVGSVVDSKLSNLKTVVETWSNGTSWYRKWSDGFIEQGGVASGANSGSWTSVVTNLPTPFKDTNYSIASSFVSMNTTYCSNGCITAKSATSFTQYFFYNNGIVPTWYACGY